MEKIILALTYMRLRPANYIQGQLLKLTALIQVQDTAHTGSRLKPTKHIRRHILIQVYF
jgi:hypothetical protein